MHRAALTAVAAALVLLGTVPAAPAKPSRRDPLVEQVRKAIREGIKYIRGKQLKDGSWEIYNVSAVQPGGVTSLALLALLTSGVPPDDPMVRKGLAYLRQLEPRHTYVRALQTMVFFEAGEDKDLERIQRNVDWLIKTRVTDGNKLLGWTYGPTGRSFPDNSNTQYAMLGLHAGHLAGAKIPQEIWDQIREFYIDSQQPGGGWIYNKQAFNTPYLTMTTAGLCGLLISGMELNRGREKPNGDGTWKNCGQYDENKPAQRALDWIAANFSVNLPYRVYYNIYGIERAGRLSGLRFLGLHDWYREGCLFLVKEQDREDGSWPKGGQFDQWPLVNTSFALLFLAKGRTPVLISKMVHGQASDRYRAGADWNNDRNDAKHLVEFVSKQLFKRQPLAWQVFDGFRGLEGQPDNLTSDEKLDNVTAELLQSPIVYFNGHEAPVFNAREKALLKKYVENGGFILAEACCGREGFRRGFERLVPEIVRNGRLEDVEPNHPVWTAFFKVVPGTFKLKCVKSGCKTVLIFSPQDLSCYWESNKTDDAKDPKAVQAFRLGANIIAYATGLELPKPRLAQVHVVRDDKKNVPPNALKVAQLNYGPDWQPAPSAMRVLMDYAERQAGIKVDNRTEEVAVDSRDLPKFKFVYMHGGKRFAFRGDELKKLRFDLETGGLLFADACCGSEAFDASFRRFLRQLFPDRKLEPIPVEGEPLFGEDLNGEKIDEKNVRCRTRKPEGDGRAAPYRAMAPALEGIKVNSRWVVIYSKYDIGCALEKQQSTDCLGYDHDSALKLGLAAVLYALKQ